MISKTELRLDIASALIRLGEPTNTGFNYYINSTQTGSLENIIQDISVNSGISEDKISECMYSILLYYIDLYNLSETNSGEHSLNFSKGKLYFSLSSRQIHHVAQTLANRLT